MEEGAASLREAGLPGEMPEGAARVFAAVAATSVAHADPSGPDGMPRAAALMDALAREIAPGAEELLHPPRA